MREIRLKIYELFEIDLDTGDRPKDLASITAYVLKHYAFLPMPIVVALEGDEATPSRKLVTICRTPGIPQSSTRTLFGPSVFQILIRNLLIHESLDFRDHVIFSHW